MPEFGLIKPGKITNSPHLAEIDQLLMGMGSQKLYLRDVQKIVREKFGLEVSMAALSKRRTGLIKAKLLIERTISQSAKETKQLNDAKEPKVSPEPTVETFSTDLLNLGQTIEAVMAMVPDRSDPGYAALSALRTQIGSTVRRVKELRDGFDHLTEMRWLLNVMEIRVSKLFEMELTMGMILKDNTTNITAMMDMIAKSIEIHQSLGLKPRFGDPKLNISVNIGGSGESKEPQNDRYKRLKELGERFRTLSPEQQVEMRKSLLVETKLAPVEAEFTEVKP